MAFGEEVINIRTPAVLRIPTLLERTVCDLLPHKNKERLLTTVLRPWRNQGSLASYAGWTGASFLGCANHIIMGPHHNPVEGTATGSYLLNRKRHTIFILGLSEESCQSENTKRESVVSECSPRSSLPAWSYYTLFHEDSVRARFKHLWGQFLPWVVTSEHTDRVRKNTTSIFNYINKCRETDNIPPLSMCMLVKKSAGNGTDPECMLASWPSERSVDSRTCGRIVPGDTACSNLPAMDLAGAQPLMVIHSIFSP